MQLVAIASCPAAVLLSEASGSLFPMTSQEVGEHSSKIPLSFLFSRLRKKSSFLRHSLTLISLSPPPNRLSFLSDVARMSKNHGNLPSLMSIQHFSPVCPPATHFVSFPQSTFSLCLANAIFKISKDVLVSSHHFSSCTYQGIQQDQVGHGVLVCRPYLETQAGPPDKREIPLHLFCLLVPFLQVSLAYRHPLKQNQGRRSDQFLKNAAQRAVT